jgi:amino acid transporter
VAIVLTMIAALIVASSIGQLAKHLPSAGSIYTYPAQGLHPVVGYLVGWGYAMITGLVGPIVNLLIGYFVGTILNTEFGWNFKAMWITFMLVSAALTALLGYRGVKLGTRFGVLLGAFEILVFVALSIAMIVKAGASAQTLSVFTLKFATVKGYNGVSGLVAGYAMGRIRLLPAAFERTSPRYESPVLGIVVQTLATVVIAFPLALGYGPVIAFELLATILTAVMLCIYIVINISTIGYYLSKARDEFNPLLHLVLPAIGAVILIPVLAAAVGVGSSVLKFVSPLPYPISEAELVVGIWFLIGLIYLAYLLRRHPERVRDMDKVFD